MINSKGFFLCCWFVLLGCISVFSQPVIKSQTENQNRFNGRYQKGGLHVVSDFGPLFEGNEVSDSLKQLNTKTIQSVLDSVGLIGGGVVKIPAGTYHITSPAKGNCLTIQYNNLTLRGAGMAQTKLCTQSEWNPEKKARAVGIRIIGTKDKANPRKNITLQDFELDGGAGWTGDYRWNSKNDYPDGWDISHKGIITASNDYVDRVLLRNLYVHSYRGEILYSGGVLAGRVEVKGCRIADTNGSCFNLYGAELLVDSTECLGPSRFWVELTARESTGGYPKTTVSFKNCTFKNAIGAQGFVICQGNNTPVSFTVQNNVFSDAPYGVFLFSGGIAGPIDIIGNTFTNCGGNYAKSQGNILDFEFGGNTENPVNNTWVKNITFADNTVEKSGDFMSFNGSWDGTPMVLENIKILRNSFSGRNASHPDSTHSVLYGESRSWYNNSLNNCEMTNVVIRENVFRDCLYPIQTGVIIGTRPLFAQNSYINCVEPPQQKSQLNQSNRRITPTCEFMRLTTSEQEVIAEMDTDRFSNGQLVQLTGGSKTNQIKFIPNADTYQVQKQVPLNGRNELWLRFEASANKWVQVQQPSKN